MGITSFTRRLGHKGERVSLQQDPSTISLHEVAQRRISYALIDGAAFAHHVYNERCKASTFQCDPISHAYDVLVQECIVFLDRLEACGFTM